VNPSRETLMRVLRTYLPADASAAIDAALEIAAFHLPTSGAGNALVNTLMRGAPNRAEDIRVTLHAWHVEKLTAMLTEAGPGTALHAKICDELDRAGDLLAQVRIQFPKKGTVPS